MSANRPKAIFLKALELASGPERAAFVEGECQGDADLRRAVEALLQAHQAEDSFLEKPAADLGQTVDAVPSQGIGEEQPGMRVGPYKLLERIGEGGMGTVWMVEQQEPVRRIVALKLIKAGMDSRAVLARFEAERQALALMDHPNIARVLDAGATQGGPGGVGPGRPFFVMELVKGTPITAFCDANKLTNRQRLDLFVAVCQAIQHAHQKGVIHRDIKPSNVLVALYDDKPVPKVIDFGVAKAAGQPLTEKTLHTGFGAIVGTPEYMSPEQATFNQLDIDTRSDVYSLGVLLYELLTGTTPVDKTRLKETALLEVLRVVREEDPPRPSVKLSTAQARASIAAVRGSEPYKLAKELRGELDWIVMKSLEKNRNRRYETAAGLGRDVERYLKDEMVEARPPSVAYRFRRFVKRNVATILVLSLVVCLLAGWVATMIRSNGRMTVLLNETIKAQLAAESQAKIAQEERKKAETNELKATASAKEARAILSFLQDKVLAAARPKGVDGGLGQGITLQQAIEAAEADLPIRFNDQPLAEASIRYSLGLTYAALDDSKPAIVQLKRALELYLKNGPAESQAALKAQEELAHQYWIVGELKEAERLMKDTITLRRQKLGPRNWEDMGQSLLTLSIFYNAQERPLDAIPLMEEVVALAKKHDAMREPLAQVILYGLGEGYAVLKRYDDAAKARKEFVELRRPLKEVPPQEPVDADNNLDRMFLNLSLRFEKMFAPTEATLIEDLEDLGTFLLRVEHPKDAEIALREVLALREKKWPETWQRYETMNLLGAALAAQKKDAEALSHLRTGYDGMVERLPKIPETSRYRLDSAAERLARHLEAAGRAEEAARIRQEMDKRKKAKTPKPAR